MFMTENEEIRDEVGESEAAHSSKRVRDGQSVPVEQGDGEKKKKRQNKSEDSVKELTKFVDSKINTEDLICEVKKLPAIWDSRLELYSDKTEKLNAWSKLMTIFIADFEERPMTEKNVMCK